MTATTAVAYIRVSTTRQERSGLGLDAQRQAIATFCASNGFEIAATYTEAESGKGHDALDRRPQLAAALAHAKKLKAPVIVSKLCRLGRDVHFVSGLMVSKVPFFIADRGMDRDPFRTHLDAAFAEQERRMISKRTREALAAARDRGAKLGSPIARQTIEKARAVLTAQTAEANAHLKVLVSDIRASGVTTLRGIASALMARGARTPRGGAVWRAEQVARLLTA